MNHEEHDGPCRWEQRLRELHPASAAPLVHRVFFAAGQRAGAASANVHGTPSRYRHWERLAWAAVVCLAVLCGHWSGRHQHQLAMSTPKTTPTATPVPVMAQPEAHAPPSAVAAMADHQDAASSPVAASTSTLSANMSAKTLTSTQTTLIPAWLGIPVSKLSNSSRAVERWQHPRGVEGGLALTASPPTRGKLLQELAPSAPAADSKLSDWLGWLQTN